jgi:hypothetical protein
MFPKPSAHMRRLRDAFFPGDSRPLSPAMCCGWGSVPPELRLPRTIVSRTSLLPRTGPASASPDGRPKAGSRLVLGRLVAEPESGIQGLPRRTFPISVAAAIQALTGAASHTRVVDDAGQAHLRRAGRSARAADTAVRPPRPGCTWTPTLACGDCGFDHHPCEVGRQPGGRSVPGDAAVWRHTA